MVWNTMKNILLLNVLIYLSDSIILADADQIIAANNGIVNNANYQIEPSFAVTNKPIQNIATSSPNIWVVPTKTRKPSKAPIIFENPPIITRTVKLNIIYHNLMYASLFFIFYAFNLEMYSLIAINIP